MSRFLHFRKLCKPSWRNVKPHHRDSNRGPSAYRADAQTTAKRDTLYQTPLTLFLTLIYVYFNMHCTMRISLVRTTTCVCKSPPPPPPPRQSETQNQPSFATKHTYGVFILGVRYVITNYLTIKPFTVI